MDIEFKPFFGAEIERQFEALAKLRIKVFRDFPYLYGGDLEYEKSYLKTYSQAPQAMMLGAFYRNSLVGATTCIPLVDETGDVQKPFLEAKVPFESIFYFGESILLSEYRGLGIGNRFFDAREAHAASFGTFKSTCFCVVVRPEDHPMRPSNYQPLDAFWQKRGYRKVPNLISEFEWKDVGESVPSSKQMIFWNRDL